MAAVAATYGFAFNQPWWLLAALLVVPVVWLGRRSLRQLGRVRRTLAIALRAAVVLLLALLLARPVLSRRHDQLTVIAVMDVSRSVPEEQQRRAQAYLQTTAEGRPAGDRIAVINVAEGARIAALPSESGKLPPREVTLLGRESRLADGVQLAMAIAPPETATRIVVFSDGNQTSGDLIEAARVSGANRIPIDVVPLPYRYRDEVVFKRLVAPAAARTGQTVPLRFVLQSTTQATGRLILHHQGQMITSLPVKLNPGVNVEAAQVTIDTRGMHRFEGRFQADDPAADQLDENNRAAAMTYVAGPGHVRVLDADGKAGAALVRSLQGSRIDARYSQAGELPTNLAELVDTDAVVLVNAETFHFTQEQQQMLVRYVQDLGGGLIMIGGPDSFGAGGWIGSPVAEVLPVDLDPPQKKEMPRGALVLVMHACEMPRGNYWGKRVAIAAVNALSREDLVGVLDYSWQGGGGRNWVHPLSKAGDKKKVIQAIKKMEMGDMPDFRPPLRAAVAALKKSQAGQKHIIVISDGDPQAPSAGFMKQMRAAGITCTTVCVFPHGGQAPPPFRAMAVATGGRFYHVRNPQKLPQIFVKEAQVVRRSLIVESEAGFPPGVNDRASEVVRGLAGAPMPRVRGYVLTGPKGGLNRLVLSARGDPLLATCQSGLGRCVAFTSSADSRWAPDWLAWGGFGRFWEQAVRWAAKSSRRGDCEVFADVQGREVTLTVEAVDAAGKFVEFASLSGQVFDPDSQGERLELSQVGPGRYRARFQAGQPGSYLVNLRYQRAGAKGEDAGGMVHTVVTVPYAPEFRDLSDNAALLRQAAEATGGRVLPSRASEARLFERTGLNMPRTPLPLTVPLLIAWVALFLADVAVRRIAVDVRAVPRAAAALFARLLPQREAPERLQRLRARREKLREQLVARRRKKAEPLAGRRYRGAETGTPASGPLPVADVDKPRQDAPAPAEPAKPPPERAAPAGPEHLQRLLRAKRKARGGRGTENDKGT